MKHVVSLSGGVGSYVTMKRVIAEHGRDGLVLLFADTKMEDLDLYRFLGDTERVWGVTITRLEDGRDPWQVFRDVKLIGNTLADPCSYHLKRKLLRKWINANCDPATTTVYIGIDWTEINRLERSRKYWKPYTVAGPLTEESISKSDMLREVKADGIEPPRLYGLGFQHNNCGGMCIKAGQGQWALLFKTMPGRYAYHEAKELETRAHIGKDVSILRDRRGGKTLPLTLKRFREEFLEPTATRQPDLFELGGCACFTPDEYYEESGA